MFLIPYRVLPNFLVLSPSFGLLQYIQSIKIVKNYVGHCVFQNDSLLRLDFKLKMVGAFDVLTILPLDTSLHY